MLVESLTNKASRVRSQAPRARRRNRNGKAAMRVAIEAVRRGRELAVAESSRILPVQRDSRSDGSAAPDLHRRC